MQSIDGIVAAARHVLRQEPGSITIRQMKQRVSISGLPKTEGNTNLMQFKQHLITRLEIYFEALQLIFRHDPKLEPIVNTQQSSDKKLGEQILRYRAAIVTLLHGLQSVTNKRFETYELCEEAFQEFFTYLVTTLEDFQFEGSPQQALHQAASIVAWEMNTRRVLTVHEELNTKNLEQDYHLPIPNSHPDRPPAPGEDTQLETRWLQHISPWLRSCLTKIYDEKDITKKGIRKEFQTGCPPTQHFIPWVPNYACHDFIVESYRTSDSTKRIHFSSLLPYETKLSRQDQIALGVRNLFLMISRELNKPKNAAPKPMIFLIQVAATGHQELDDMNHQVIEGVRARLTDAFPKENGKPPRITLIESCRILDSDRGIREEYRSPDLSTWKHRNLVIGAEIYKAVGDHLILEFGQRIESDYYGIFPGHDKIRPSTWTDVKTQSLMSIIENVDPKPTNAQLNHAHNLLKLTEGYYTTFIDTDAASVNLNLMRSSFEQLIINAIGGVNMTCVGKDLSGVVMMMHADTLLEYYCRSHQDPRQRTFPPNNGQNGLAYARFIEFLAERVRSNHHQSFLATAMPGAQHSLSALPKTLSTDVQHRLEAVDACQRISTLVSLEITLANNQTLKNCLMTFNDLLTKPSTDINTLSSVSHMCHTYLNNFAGVPHDPALFISLRQKIDQICSPKQSQWAAYIHRSKTLETPKGYYALEKSKTWTEWLFTPYRYLARIISNYMIRSSFRHNWKETLNATSTATSFSTFVNTEQTYRAEEAAAKPVFSDPLGLSQRVQNVIYEQSDCQSIQPGGIQP